MVAIPKKVSDRFVKEFTRYKRVINQAKKKDVNESDTVTIITDMLSDIFGYDKYIEITREQAIRNTYCDLAVELDGKTRFLIEAKAIGISLNNNHLNQALNYGANKGIHWVILTNGDEWQIHRLQNKLPLSHDLVCSFKISEMHMKSEDDKSKLFLICKEGVNKSAIEEFHDYVQSVNKHTIGSAILTEPVLNTIRREIRKFTSGVKVTTDEIKDIIQNSVIKREIIDSEEMSSAEKKFNRINKKKN